MTGFNQHTMKLEAKIHQIQKEYAQNEAQIQSAFNVMADELKEAKIRIAMLEEMLREARCQ